MKGILEFDLSEHDGKMNFQAAVNAGNMALVLWQLKHNAYKELTHNKESEDYWQGVNDTIQYVLDQLDVDPDVMTY